jgi:hypothetical protein
MLTWRGKVAALYWSYLPAAELGAWTITATPQGADVTATVIRHDAYRTAQPALTFQVPRDKAVPWVWTVESLQIAGSMLTARLSQKD